jgi:hypothetical protein
VDGFRHISNAHTRPSGELSERTERTPEEFHRRAHQTEIPMADETLAQPKPVLKEASATSWKTTVTGLGLAIGLVAEELIRAGFPDDAAGWVGLLTKALGPTLLGWFARDKNVTSEGNKVVTPTPRG